MFARENKIEVMGMGELSKPVAKASPSKKAEAKEATVLNTVAEPAAEAATLSFDLDTNSN